MSILRITEQKAKKLNEVEDLALDVIRDALKNNIQADTDEVKIAVKAIAVVAKNRQTTTHRAAINFGMAMSIASEAQLKKYIQVTNPAVKKALEGRR